MAMALSLKPRHWWLLLSTLAVVISTAGADASLEKRSLSQLEQRLAQIDNELSQLAHCSLRSGVGSIGYRSEPHQDSSAKEWVEVTFDKVYPIDEIILVPTLWRDSNAGFQADGFPQGFRVLVGTAENQEGKIIASFDPDDDLLPRIAPLTISAEGQKASWVRIETTHLSQRAFDQSFIFQLSELMIFSGQRNIALRRQVTASSVHPQDLIRAWRKRYLVDGFMPYLMDAAQGAPSVAYISSVAKHPAFTIDLGVPSLLSAIHLHAVDQSDTVPQAYAGNLGLPKNLLIEGALKPDFSDATLMLEAKLDGDTNVGPVMMWPLKETNARYVRIRSPDRDAQTRFGFAEIELFSQGKNVALHKQVHPEWSSPPKDSNSSRTLAALTDGRNLYGNILPVRSWVDQLSRRHDLESERPLVAFALAQRYEAQKRNLSLMTWVAALLAVAVAFSILINRFLRLATSHPNARTLRRRPARRARSQHSHHRTPRRPRERYRLTRRTRRSFSNAPDSSPSAAATPFATGPRDLESRGLCEDLVEEMKRATNSLLADIDHDLSFEGTEFIEKLKPRRRIDTFLFYKECLVNIIRHSQATHVATQLEASPKGLILTIADNGQGLLEQVPPS